MEDSPKLGPGLAQVRADKDIRVIAGFFIQDAIPVGGMVGQLAALEDPRYVLL
jgi:hypothetical protein